MILVALGSNIEPRASYLQQARDQMELHGIAVVKASTVIETPALLKPGAPASWNVPFLNQVVAVRTAQLPVQLLGTLKKIEWILGRRSSGVWGPREIDLDMLAYDGLVMQSHDLTLPHAEMHTRDFVLKPLAEIAPDWMHPRLLKTASQLVKELP